MRFRSKACLTSLTVLLLLSFATKTNEAKARHMLTGAQNTERTNRLTSEIRWHRSLAQAQEDARREGKLVFWVNMLGTLSGAT